MNDWSYATTSTVPYYNANYNFVNNDCVIWANSINDQSFSDWILSAYDIKPYYNHPVHLPRHRGNARDQRRLHNRYMDVLRVELSREEFYYDIKPVVTVLYHRQSPMKLRTFTNIRRKDYRR